MSKLATTRIAWWCCGGATAAGLAIAGATACGGRAGPSAHGNDAGFDAGPVVIGPDGCVAEGGYLACRGSNDCPTSSSACLECLGDPDATGLCATEANGTMALVNCPLCDDGNVCVRIYEQAPYFCLPFDVGQLFASNGSADRVKYADWSDWTGQVLPKPTTCGDGGLPLCGGLCGPCAQGQTCTGRSPIHPYGFCVPSTWGDCTRSKPACAASGDACFVFDDPPDAQGLADQYGLCIPTSECQALGAGYPGGATCIGGG